MNKRIAFGLLIALVVCGCQIKEDGEFAPEGKPFTATMEAISDGAIDTKTSLDANGNVRWKQGDQVSLFAASTINERYQVTDESDGKTYASLYQVSKPGFVAEGDGKYTVVLDTNLTDELLELGFVRELVSRIQQTRKDNGYEVTDHIEIYAFGDKKTNDTLNKFAKDICADTLADKLVAQKIDGQVQVDINGSNVDLYIKKV